MKSRVAVVKVADYDPQAVLDGVRDCLNQLGGMGAFVSRGQRVLLKPNLLGAFIPQRAVTTHPAVVRAAGILVREQGGQAVIGDSPGFGEFTAVMRRCGMMEVVDELGAELADFKTAVGFAAPENTVARHIELARAVKEADVIISLPKLKTHAQMGFTGALKNQYGLVVGAEKAHYHYRLKTRDWLASLMIDINRIAKPALAIMDGIVGMEGLGPAGGEPRQMGAVLASGDCSALDTIACLMIGLHPEHYALLQAAQRCDYGVSSASDIEQLGVPWQELAQRDWKKVPQLLSTRRILPIPECIQRWLGNRWSLRPRVIADLCLQCMACNEGCPVDPPAIDPKKGTQAVDDERCIRCYCCHEFCQHKAIDLKRLWWG